jgi:hypothetical protein
VERLGIVYITRSDPGHDACRFTGYWDRGEPPEMLEQGPGWDDLHDAVTWGNERAPRILVRLGANEETIYSAGEIRLINRADGSGVLYPVWP